MRPSRLALPLAMLLSLLVAAPAGAADSTVEVNDFSFMPAGLNIDVGDTVTWNFAEAGHNTKSLRGQPDSWKSTSDNAPNAVGDVFAHEFDTPGRYGYICGLHPTFMKGTVTVGTDTVADTVTRFRTRKFGHRVKISYVLHEPAIVRYRLRGPSAKRVKKGRQLTGAYSFTVRHLRTGSYRGTLTAVDDFDKKNISKKSFVIG